MREARFDDIIHAPARLRICGLMRAVKQMDFAVLRDSLGISGAHIRALREIAGAAGQLNCSSS